MATPSSNMDKSDVDMTEINEDNSGADIEAGVVGVLDSPKVSATRAKTVTLL
jgi:hypothetical protein